MKDAKNRTKDLAALALVVGVVTNWIIWRELAGNQHRSSCFTGPVSFATFKASEAYGKLPLSFEINRGQADDHIKFLSRGSGYSLYLTDTEAIFQLRKADCRLRREERDPAGDPGDLGF